MIVWWNDSDATVSHFSWISKTSSTAQIIIIIEKPSIDDEDTLLLRSAKRLIVN